MLKGLGWLPDAILANDWQTAMVPLALKLHPAVSADAELSAIPVVFSIHNISYQGLFPAYTIDQLGLPPAAFTPDVLEHWGDLSLLKGAIATSDWLVTVSPTYAREIQRPEFGFGLEGVIRARRARLSGILNGIDVNDWNPATDPALPAHFGRDDLGGKELCKHHLQQHFGLSPEPRRPLMGMISRLVDQKGLDILVEILPELLKDKLQLVLLGAGQPHYHQRLRRLARRFPDKLGVELGFNEKLARLIEAGADVFLMPSRFEPCGLNQLYSLRYGTVPIVRRTGGLADSIVAATARTLAQGKATGFMFTPYEGRALMAAIRRALRLYRTDPEGWRRLVRTAMAQDFSWERSARSYQRLIARLTRRRPA
jgi:starch synthase